MANEIYITDTVGDQAYDYRLLVESMIDALYPANNVLNLMRRKSIASFASNAERFWIVPELAAAAVLETDPVPNVPWTSNSLTLTVGEVAIGLERQRMASTSEIVDWAFYGQQAGRAVLKKITSDLTGLVAGFDTDVGTPGAALTEADFLTGIATLATRDVVGPLAAVLYPNQWYRDLVQDIGSSYSPSATTGGTARGESNDLPSARQIRDGFIGEVYGVNVVLNSTVPTLNAGVDSGGGMFEIGQALGYVEKWFLRPEMDTDIHKRTEQLVVTAAYAVGELDDTRGVGIVTLR